jgi:hypothetical protein
MSRHKPETEKQLALRPSGTLNPRPQDVRHPLFQGNDFFDPDDTVQVKYEMLRQVHVDHQPLSKLHEILVFSPSFYQANSSFSKAGLAGLAPSRRGPKGGHKLTPEVMALIVAKQAESSLTVAQLAELIKERFDIQVHPRSIQRQLLREKKRR